VRASPSTRKGKTSKWITYAQQVIKDNGNDSAPTDSSKGSRKFRKRRSEEEAKLYSTVAVSFHSGTMERLLTSAPLIGLKLFYLVSGRYYNYTIDAIVCL